MFVGISHGIVLISWAMQAECNDNNHDGIYRSVQRLDLHLLEAGPFRERVSTFLALALRSLAWHEMLVRLEEDE